MLFFLRIKDSTTINLLLLSLIIQFKYITLVLIYQKSRWNSIQKVECVKVYYLFFIELKMIINYKKQSQIQFDVEIL